jgi:hypothetical protein
MTRLGRFLLPMAVTVSDVVLATLGHAVGLSWPVAFLVVVLWTLNGIVVDLMRDRGEL